MTPIPDDFHAAQDLKRQFRELGEQIERERSAAQPRRRWRWSRTTGVGVIAVGVLAAGAGAARIFVHSGHDVRSDRGTPSDIARAPADERLSAARVDDPDGGLPWGARTYVSRTSETCVVVGRVLAGRLGVMTGGKFSALPDDAPGSCAPNGSNDPLVAVRRYPGATAARTVVYGVVTRSVHSVSFLGEGAPQNIPVAEDGVFLGVLRGAGSLEGDQVRFGTASGPVIRRLH